MLFSKTFQDGKNFMFKDSMWRLQSVLCCLISIFAVNQKLIVSHSGILHLTLSQTSPAWFLRVCCTSLLKTLWEKEKLLVMSNFSFSHNVFYPLGELSAIFIKFEVVV